MTRVTIIDDNEKWEIEDSSISIEATPGAAALIRFSDVTVFPKDLRRMSRYDIERMELVATDNRTVSGLITKAGTMDRETVFTINTTT